MTIKYCDACSLPVSELTVKWCELSAPGPKKSYDLCDKCHEKLLNILKSQSWQIPLKG